MATRTPTRRGKSGRKRVSTKTTKKPTRKSRVSMLARLRAFIRETLGRQADDVWGVVLLVVASLMVLGFIGEAGPVGRWIVSGLRLLFGLWSVAFPVALAALGVVLIIGKHRDDYGRLTLGLVTAFIGSLSLFHLLTGTVPLWPDVDPVLERGGAVGSLLSFPLRRLVGYWGAFVVLAAVTSLGVLVLSKATVRQLFMALGEILGAVRSWASALRMPARPARHARAAVAANHRPPQIRPIAPQPADQGPRKKAPVGKPRGKARPGPGQTKIALPEPKPGEGYQIPPLELLKGGSGEAQSKRVLEQTALDLEDTLRQHGVDARLTKIVPGPTVTRYEIELQPGVKVSRVTSLANDIAYALATPDVRLLAPIPGKSAIGIEVPNRKRRLITLGDVLKAGTDDFDGHPLEVALGMDISGRPKLINLSELPHVLIAGATGAGKSSCINSIVTSLLMRTTPDDVRLIMVDPKRVELGQYNGVPHLFTKVITNPKKAADALKWAVAEMDRRYDLLADAHVRDIDGYREKWDAGNLDPDGFDRFPFVVVVVDELNDLMMVAGREVEDAIVRIAQMARAVGIHLVIATQRPSVDVITGVIKANIPSRMAFSVASQADSRVILDGSGAEKLIGMGDMLVVTAKDPKAERIQGAWVSEEEVHAVVAWVKKQREAQYHDKVIETLAKEAKAVADDEDDDDAELVRQAIELVVRSQLGSTSMLQRKLRVGFARAGRIMDILERKGVVGQSEGSKARTVLMTVDDLEESLASSDN